MDENNTNLENNSSESISDAKSPSSYEAPTQSERSALGSSSYDSKSETSASSGSAFIIPENNKQSGSTSHQEVFGGTVEGSANNNYYTNTQANTYTNDSEGESNGFAIASLVMGILSILTCCCSPLAILLGILGIIFFCVQPKNSVGKRPTMATVGLILSIVGIVIAVGSIIIGIIYGSSDMYKEILENSAM